MKLTYQSVMAAFQPAKEITDPSRFSGRKVQIEGGTQLLLAGDHIFIYGPRGIGKSSIARQLQLIAAGNVELLDALESDLKDENLDYATCFLTRDESINNLNQLLYRLLIDQKCLAQFSYLFDEFGPIGTYPLGADLDPKLVSDFWRRADLVATKHKTGLAIFVDEFELMKSHDGFSSFLKAQHEGVIFVVTGIAGTEKELVRDHKSIDRQLTTGKLPLEVMGEVDLRRVVQKAEESINRGIRFNENAVQRLVQVVHGQPYLLHLIGRTALITAFKHKSSEVTLDTLKEALSNIVTSKLDSTLEERYLKAIGQSPQRESILRILADSCNPGAFTSSVYPIAEKLGITNPSNYVGALQKDDFGEEIRKLGDQYYGFKDYLFQSYVVATPARLEKFTEGANEISSEINENLSKCTDNSIFEILHFSDIHFGSTHFFSSLPSSIDNIPDADKPTFERYINEAIERDNIDPSVVVISGDLTQNGQTNEFQKATNSLAAVIKHIVERGTSTPSVVMCPGNHDVNWASGKADPEARYMPFQAYLTARNSITTGKRFDSNIDPERIYEIHEDSKERKPAIIFAAFNSAVVESDADHRGYIGQSQLDNALKEIDSINGSSEQIRIAVFHHHLIPAPTVESNVEPEKVMADSAHVKQRLQAAGFRIALHGHRHHAHSELITSDKGQQLLVIGCGSSGVIVKERGEQRLQFNRITVVTDKKHIEVRISVYEFDSSLRRWGPTPGVPPHSFYLDRFSRK